MKGNSGITWLKEGQINKNAHEEQLNLEQIKRNQNKQWQDI